MLLDGIVKLLIVALRELGVPHRTNAAVALDRNAGRHMLP